MIEPIKQVHKAELERALTKYDVAITPDVLETLAAQTQSKLDEIDAIDIVEEIIHKNIEAHEFQTINATVRDKVRAILNKLNKKIKSLEDIIATPKSRTATELEDAAHKLYAYRHIKKQWQKLHDATTNKSGCICYSLDDFPAQTKYETIYNVYMDVYRTEIEACE